MTIHRVLVDIYQPPEFRTLMQQEFPETKILSLGESSGDVLIQTDNKTILIETKEPNDLLSSIADGRVFRQCEGMRKASPWSFLLYKEPRYDKQGYVLALRNGSYGPTKWTADHIDGVLTSIQARGIITRPVRYGWIDTIQRIVRWCESADSGSITREPIKLSPFDSSDQAAVNLLSLFDGIGVKQAKSFLKWAGRRPLHEYWDLALTFFDGDNKPDGWTNHTIERNREQMGYAKPKQQRTEWVEELDVS